MRSRSMIVDSKEETKPPEMSVSEAVLDDPELAGRDTCFAEFKPPGEKVEAQNRPRQRKRVLLTPSAQQFRI